MADTNCSECSDMKDTEFYMNTGTCQSNMFLGQCYKKEYCPRCGEELDYHESASGTLTPICDNCSC